MRNTIIRVSQFIITTFILYQITITVAEAIDRESADEFKKNANNFIDYSTEVGHYCAKAAWTCVFGNLDNYHFDEIQNHDETSRLMKDCSFHELGRSPSFHATLKSFGELFDYQGCANDRCHFPTKAWECTP